MAKDKGKTKTIKKRTVYVYAPSLETVDRWKAAAEEAGQSLSKFIIECIENEVSSTDDFQSKADLLKQTQELQEENSELRKRVKMLEALTDKQEKEIKRLKSKSFVEKEEGERQYDRELVELLRNRTKVSYDDIIEYLDVDRTDKDMMRAVNKQLDNLEAYGLIVSVKEGYRWQS